MALRAAGAKADTADRVVAQAKATKTGPVIMMVSSKSQKSMGKKEALLFLFVMKEWTAVGSLPFLIDVDLCLGGEKGMMMLPTSW